MKLKELATNVKFWIATGTAVVVALVALGMDIDRPAWANELKPVIEQAGDNKHDILEIKINRLTDMIWQQEDRLDRKHTEDGNLRLRELKKRRKDMERELQQLENKGEG